MKRKVSVVAEGVWFFPLPSSLGRLLGEYVCYRWNMIQQQFFLKEGTHLH
jgi:hypothetical protein